MNGPDADEQFNLVSEPLDKLENFYLVSFSTAECLTCDENITVDSNEWGNLREIVRMCLAHECPE